MNYLNALRADPRVESVSDERYGDPDGGDGIWVYLRHGWDANSDPWVVCRTVHEWSIKDLRAAMRDVKADDKTKTDEG